MQRTPRGAAHLGWGVGAPCCSLDRWKSCSPPSKGCGGQLLWGVWLAQSSYGLKAVLPAAPSSLWLRHRRPWAFCPRALSIFIAGSPSSQRAAPRLVPPGPPLPSGPSHTCSCVTSRTSAVPGRRYGGKCVYSVISEVAERASSPAGAAAQWQPARRKSKDTRLSVGTGLP